MTQISSLLLKKDAEGIQHMSEVYMRQLRWNTTTIIFFAVKGLHPLHPKAGVLPQTPVSSVVSSAYKVNKPACKNKWKSNDNFGEYWHFGVDRRVLDIFFQSQNI